MGSPSTKCSITLSPKFKQAYKQAGRSKPKPITITITTDPKGKYSGRFIGIFIKFPNFASCGMMIKGGLKLFISSVYHPYEL